MPEQRTRREDYIAQLVAQGRRHSTSTILFHQVLAECLGLNPTDHKCLDLIIQRQPITAGELANLTGLTTGSITTVLDRLERAGFVRRESDPTDRRRVLVRANVERVPEIERLFEGFLAALTTALERYSDDQLAVILDYLTTTTAVLDEQAAALKRAATVKPQRSQQAVGDGQAGA